MLKFSTTSRIDEKLNSEGEGEVSGLFKKSEAYVNDLSFNSFTKNPKDFRLPLVTSNWYLAGSLRNFIFSAHFSFFMLLNLESLMTPW